MRSELVAIPSEPASGSTASRYRDILKSTALIGGSSAINFGIGFLRTKALAVLLGPAGFGVMGMFVAIADVARSCSDFGINGSGVRQIAAAVATGDSRRIGRTVSVLRRTALGLGLFGATLLAVASPAVARFSFGDERYAGAIALLSVVVFLRIVADAHGALIQGMRRIADLATLGILGSAFGVAVAIPIIYWWGVDGIVPSFIVAGAISLLLAWRMGHRLHPQSDAMPLCEFLAEFKELIRLGAAFMASGLLMMTAAYAVRTLVLRQEGAEAAGLYGAAWALAGLWVGFILQAMGTDFYPRLVAEVEDDARCNAIVNEQTEVSLLLAAPGMLATITLAPAIVSLLYSAAFAGSAELMRWLLLGMALRVVTWPMGFIIVARNRRRVFVFAEVAWTAVNLALSFYLVDRLGLNGAGVAFFLSYVFHGLMIYPLVRRLSGFRWTATSRKLIFGFALSLAVVFASLYGLPAAQATAVGIAVSLLSVVCSVRKLLRMTSADRVPHRLQRLLRLVRARS